MSRTMNIRWPEGGENRSASYAQRARPYSTPKCRNVQRVGPLETRERGGSRPGISKYVSTDFGTNICGIQDLSYLDSSNDIQHDMIVIADGALNIVQGSTVTTTTAYLTYGGDFLVHGGDNLISKSTISSTNPLGNSNSFQIIQHGGKLYIADSYLTRYDPTTGEVLLLSDAPTSQPLVAVYKERLVLAGDNHIIQMSRQGDFFDWNYGDTNHKDVARAIATFVGDKGIIGSTVNHMKVWRDQAMVFGCDDSIWTIEGVPGIGPKRNVSRHVGIIAPDAATITPNGVLVFLAREGLYRWQIGSQQEPEPLSPEIVPEKLKDVVVTTNDISMIYDQKNKGIYLFVTPNSGTGEHWWIDLDNYSLWPITFASDNHQPLVVTTIPTANYSDVIMGCKDGYIRTFDKANTTDDTEDIESDIFFGPFHVSGEFGMNGMIKELRATFADNSTGLTWKLYTANTAEEVVDNAETDLNGGTTTYLYGGATGRGTGSWAENYNQPVYPRARGPWCILWVSGTSKWSYEQITMKLEKLGRIR